MRISNLGTIELSQVTSPSGNMCSITTSASGQQLTYEVTSSDGLSVSGQISYQAYADFTPQGAAPYAATLNFPNWDIGPITVNGIKSVDADIAVVYVNPWSQSINGQKVNGPYAWVSNPQAE